MAVLPNIKKMCVFQGLDSGSTTAHWVSKVIGRGRYELECSYALLAQNM